ncbi:flagellar basal body P-ring formation chaperone FlgA [Teredinibacter sp. KSP-S5-2]|uniref:flagellar basal body P-ring formation chaperone FlgA n=1 Tax=Teredinibacter sp. KSP-S5-2 TaxID=3034506 RepID=UPI002934FFD3|nr:flagellar basal body P-ring formation chaperone FlgA [Teredinibacter sp. KSP-S5-2]WNO11346.1 flagellar basal body P-ring formation chaperone FlgA [Teredinibacter sp. KSP-S5-2]
MTLLPFIFSSLLISDSFECSPESIIETKREIVAPVSNVAQATCQKLSKKYRNISTVLIGRRTTPNISADELGEFNIGALKAGRIKVTWKGLKGKKKAEFWYKVSATGEAWIARKNIPPMSVIKKNDIKKEEVNIARYEGINHIFYEYPPIGLISTKRIRKGQTLFKENLSSPPMISKGKTIKAVLTTNDVKIIAIGEALEYGWNVNDVISIRVQNSEGSIKAKIISEDEVHII